MKRLGAQRLSVRDLGAVAGCRGGEDRGVVVRLEHLVVSRGLHPHARQTLRTHARGYDMEVVEVALDGTVTDMVALSRAMSGAVSAVFVQQPNFLGAVEDVAAAAATAAAASIRWAHKAPHPTPVRRLDEVRAARELTVTQRWDA